MRMSIGTVFVTRLHCYKSLHPTPILKDVFLAHSDLEDFTSNGVAFKGFMDEKFHETILIASVWSDVRYIWQTHIPPKYVV